MLVRYNTSVVRQPSINSTKEKRDAYLEDTAKILSHMERFREAVEDARIKLGIPGGLPYDKRAEWYGNFYLRPDQELIDNQYTSSQNELIPPNKMLRAVLQKISDDFNLDSRWHSNLLSHIAGDDIPLSAPAGLPYVEARLNDARLPKEKWVVERMWVELYSDTTQKDMAAIWDKIEEYQSMMAVQFPEKRRPMKNVDKYIKIRNLEEKGLKHSQIVKDNPDLGFPTYKELGDFKKQIEDKFSSKKK